MDGPSWLSSLGEQLGPEKVKNYFYGGQVLIGALFVGGLLWARGRQTESGFRVREADRPRARPESRVPAGPGGAARQDDLAHARIRRQEPLRLTGIRIDGAPHEILGVAFNAKEPEVTRAYRELMKQYHPDKIGSQGSREWKDAQRIAEAINRAKDEMLRRIRGRT